MLGFLYWIGPMGAFDSLCHAFSTMSTGGFSTHADSIGAWNSLYIKIVTTVFMFIGGVNFALIFKLSTGHVRSVWQNETFRLYLMLILSVFVFFDVALLINSSVTTDWESLTIDPLFQIISIMSSTGYLVEGSENWGNAIFSVTLLLMFSVPAPAQPPAAPKSTARCFCGKTHATNFTAASTPTTSSRSTPTGAPCRLSLSTK